ncbi:hypothetical protein LINGRAPRIM_LOCUS2588 [Linum grandiflorum]
MEITKFVTRNCSIKMTLHNTFECELEEEGYVVKLNQKSCSCGYWDLSDITCLHDVAAISYMRHDVYQYINEYYFVENARKAYGHGVPRLRGKQAWVVAQ